MKYFILLLVFVTNIGVAFSQFGQIGEGNYKMRANFNIYKLSGDNNYYQTEVCELDFYELYFENLEKYTLDIYTQEGDIVYSSGDREDWSHIFQLYNYQIFERKDLIIVANKADTVGILEMYTMPLMQVDSVTIAADYRVGLQDGNKLILCNEDEESYVNLSTIVHVGWCGISYFNYWENYKINGTEISGNRVKVKDLDDGDTITAKIDFWEPMVNDMECGCFEAFHPLESKPMYIVKNRNCVITGVQNQGLKSQIKFKAFPNPAYEKIHVTSSVSGKLILIDLSGREVYSSSLENETIINTQRLNPGMYFLKLEHSDGILSDVITVK